MNKHAENAITSLEIKIMTMLSKSFNIETYRMDSDIPIINKDLYNMKNKSVRGYIIKERYSKMISMISCIGNFLDNYSLNAKVSLMHYYLNINDKNLINFGNSMRPDRYIVSNDSYYIELEKFNDMIDIIDDIYKNFYNNELPNCINLARDSYSNINLYKFIDIDNIYSNSDISILYQPYYCINIILPIRVNDHPLRSSISLIIFPLIRKMGAICIQEYKDERNIYLKDCIKYNISETVHLYIIDHANNKKHDKYILYDIIHNIIKTGLLSYNMENIVIPEIKNNNNMQIKSIILGNLVNNLFIEYNDINNKERSKLFLIDNIFNEAKLIKNVSDILSIKEDYRKYDKHINKITADFNDNKTKVKQLTKETNKLLCDYIAKQDYSARISTLFKDKLKLIIEHNSVYNNKNIFTCKCVKYSNNNMIFKITYNTNDNIQLDLLLLNLISAQDKHLIENIIYSKNNSDKVNALASDYKNMVFNITEKLKELNDSEIGILSKIMTDYRNYIIDNKDIAINLTEMNELKKSIKLYKTDEVVNEIINKNCNHISYKDSSNIKDFILEIGYYMNRNYSIYMLTQSI